MLSTPFEDAGIWAENIKIWPTPIDPEASVYGPKEGVSMCSHGICAHIRAHLRQDCAQRPQGQSTWGPDVDTMVPPYFEGADSIPCHGLPKFKVLSGFWVETPQT